eukprot:3745593-Ditylum_brightwellii.AAC.1
MKAQRKNISLCEQFDETAGKVLAGPVTQANIKKEKKLLIKDLKDGIQYPKKFICKKVIIVQTSLSCQFDGNSSGTGTVNGVSDPDEPQPMLQTVFKQEKQTTGNERMTVHSQDNSKSMEEH